MGKVGCLSYWIDGGNGRRFLDASKKILKIKHWKDWYRINTQQFIDIGGRSLLNCFNGSPSQLIMSVYPEYPWKLLDFGQVPQRYWTLHENRLAFLESMKSSLNINQPEDWYNVSQRNIMDFGGASLLDYFGGSPSRLIMTVYPNFEWNELRFKHTSRSYWSNQDNVERFMKKLEEKLQIKRWEDWYNVTSKDIIDLGGTALIARFNGSPSQLVMKSLPQHSWEIYRFGRVKITSWTPSMARSLLNSVISQQNIFESVDWRTLSRTHIMQHKGGSSLLSKVGSLPDILR